MPTLVPERETREAARREMIQPEHVHACAIFLYELHNRDHRRAPYRIGAVRMLRWSTGHRLHYCLTAATMAVERLQAVSWDWNKYQTRYADSGN